MRIRELEIRKEEGEATETVLLATKQVRGSSIRFDTLVDVKGKVGEVKDIGRSQTNGLSVKRILREPALDAEQRERRVFRLLMNEVSVGDIDVASTMSN